MASISLNNFLESVALCESVTEVVESIISYKAVTIGSLSMKMPYTVSQVSYHSDI